jgi:hypothetical protein
MQSSDFCFSPKVFSSSSSSPSIIASMALSSTSGSSSVGGGLVFGTVDCQYWDLFQVLP